MAGYNGVSRKKVSEMDVSEKEVPEMEWTKQEIEELNRQNLNGTQRSIRNREKLYETFREDSPAYMALDLDNKEATQFEENPHLRQTFINRNLTKIPLKSYPGKPAPFTEKDLLIDLKKKLKYSGRRKLWKSVAHVGQLKLLLSEINFFNAVFEHDSVDNLDKYVVIYAGAAPGTHTNFLASMFGIHFILIDPARFTARKDENIVGIINEYMTDKLASVLGKKYKNKRILFVSDIRSIDNTMCDTDKEKRVLIDLIAQQKWIDIMKPYAFMLKFRMTYMDFNKLELKKIDSNAFVSPTKMKYFVGDLYTQQYAGATSSESRLIGIKPVHYDSKKKEWKTTVYDIHDWEDALYYFNNITRVSMFANSCADSVDGLDHCYDCAAYTFIIKQYCEKFGIARVLNGDIHSEATHPTSGGAKKTNDVCALIKKINWEHHFTYAIDPI